MLLNKVDFLLTFSIEMSAVEQAPLDDIVKTALWNPKNRPFMLQTDLDIEAFLKDKSRHRFQFAPLNSYYRLVMHRMAPYYNLAHVVDSKRGVVILYKNADSRLPNILLRDIPAPDADAPIQPSTADNNSLSQNGEQPAAAAARPFVNRQMKIMQRHNVIRERPMRSDTADSKRGQLLSLEEKEAAYMRARAEIFQGHVEDSTFEENGYYNEQQQQQQQPDWSTPIGPVYYPLPGTINTNNVNQYSNYVAYNHQHHHHLGGVDYMHHTGFSPAIYSPAAIGIFDASISTEQGIVQALDRLGFAESPRTAEFSRTPIEKIGFADTTPIEKDPE